MFRQFHPSTISSDSLLAGYDNSIAHQLKRRFGNSPFGNEGAPPGTPPGTPPAGTPPAGGVDPKELANLVNSVVTAHLKREMPTLVQSVTTELGKTVAAQFEEFKKTLPQPTATPPADPPAGGDKKQSPELLAVQRQLEEVKKQLDQSNANAAKIAQDAKDEKTLGQIKKSMTDAKVRPELVDVLAANWFKVENKIVVDDSGAILVKARGEPYPGAGEQDIQLPLGRALDEFLKTPQGQVFLPAPTPTPPHARNAPRVPVTTAGTPPAGSTGIPTIEQDPDWHNKMAAELAPHINPGLLG